MPDYTDARHSPLNELDDTNRFVLQNRSEIRLLLITLARRPDIISAYFNDGKEYILTAVLGVLEERGLLVLDYGPDEAQTKRAIASGRLVCTTKHHGVPIRFSCERLQSARFKGMPAIATPMPESLFRRQRRQFFRVHPPKINGPGCEISHGTGEPPCKLEIIDLSAGGLGALDRSGRLQGKVGERLTGCRLYLPAHGEMSITMVIRNISEVTTDDNLVKLRYGFSFEGLQPGESAELQRYLFQLQAQQPK
ncbi:MAG: flagellar brake protein [Chromatiales bacterium]|nr:flagellar brake protein [Chromatiales bacterium]